MEDFMKRSQWSYHPPLPSHHNTGVCCAALQDGQDRDACPTGHGWLPTTQHISTHRVSQHLGKKKIQEKILTTCMSHISESLHVLHQGHYGARPNVSSQEALIHLVLWIKAQWRACWVVGTTFADVNSAFLSVHHPHMIETLENQGDPLKIINMIQSFLTSREKYIWFNSFKSQI